MPPPVNPEMLVLARGSRGMTQADASARFGWSHTKLSKHESGMLVTSDDDLVLLSSEYDYPPEFFCLSDAVYGFGSCCMYHRKRQSVPVKALNIIHDRVNILRMRLGRLLRNADAHQENGFHRLDIDEYGGSPERIAQLIRAAWKLPMGPVKNLVGAIENAGGIVVPCSFGTTKLDAVSQWPRNMPPIFFINKDIPVDRWRFTLAHEVGHIVMHAIPTPNAEKEADRFASEFLMPERMIRHDLDNITLEKAAALKPYWRVSIQALFRRAKDVGKMTDRRYISLCAYISKLGYRKIEPVTIAPEEPTVLRNLIRFHREEHGFSVSDLGKLMLISEQELREQFLDEGACPLRVVS